MLPQNTPTNDYVQSGGTGEAAASPPSGDTETGGVPVSPAPARSQTNLANQPPRGRLTGTPGAAFRRSAAERETSRSYSARTKPPPAVPQQARRRGDAAAVPANPSPLGQAGAAPERDTAVDTRHGLPITGTVRKALNPWAVAACVLGMTAMAVLSVMFWPTARDAKGQESALKSGAAGVSASQQPNELPAEPSAALTTALDHLSTAIDGAAEGSPEEILRKASTPGQDCTMVWVNNSPSLVFGRYPIRENSLAHTLEACAQAVLRLH